MKRKEKGRKGREKGKKGRTKGKKKENKRNRGKKGCIKLVKKLRLLHTLEIY